MIYITQKGDVLDLICYRHFSDNTHYEETLLNNPHLSRYGVVFPAGIEIKLSELENKASEEKQTLNLWD